MQLAYSDGRPIAELTDVRPAKTIGNAPVEFSATIPKEGAAILAKDPASFYRATDGEERFTLTVDRVVDGKLDGTIRRR